MSHREVQKRSKRNIDYVGLTDVDSSRAIFLISDAKTLQIDRGHHELTAKACLNIHVDYPLKHI